MFQEVVSVGSEVEPVLVVYPIDIDDRVGEFRNHRVVIDFLDRCTDEIGLDVLYVIVEAEVGLVIQEGLH